MPVTSASESRVDNKFRVVIVDDDPDMGSLLKMRLQHESDSFSITTLGSGTECLAYLEDNHADCVLSDYQMPGMDGMELLVSLREKGNDVPFIFVTGQGNEEVAREAFKNGAFDYFTKEIGFAHFSKISNSVQKAIEQTRASADRSLMESALRKAAYGVSSITGEDFFDELVRYLAESIGADYALVGEIVDLEKRLFRTRSVYAKGEFIPDIEYELKGSPCDDMQCKEPCCFPTGVRELYPDAALLDEMGVESYAGTPLFDSSGNPLGKLVVLDSKPMNNTEYVKSLLQIFAGRASAELERIRVEDSLRKSEEKYRTLMDHASDAIILGDPATGIIIDANTKAEKLLGRTAAALAGMHQTELHPPEEADRYARMFREHMSAGGATPIEAEVVNRAGERITVEITASIVGIDGRPVFQAILRDLTERKKAETAVTELGTILERSLNEIYIFDAERLTFVRANEGALANLGYSMEELERLTPLDIKPEFTLERFEEMIAPLRAGDDKVKVFTTTHKRRDGTLYPAEVHLQMSEYGGRPVFVAIILDISARKSAEDALRESDARFRLIAENIDGVLWVTTPDDSAVEYVSPVYEKVWGLPAAELNERPEAWIEAIHEEDRERVLNALKAKSEDAGNGYGYRADFRIVRPDGEVRWISDKGFPVLGEDGRPSRYVGIAQDITERKKTEDRLMHSEKFLSDILSSTRDGISVLDRDMNIVRVNTTMEKWYAHSMPLVGKKCYEAYKGKDTPCAICPTREALDTNRPAVSVVPKLGDGAESEEWVEVYSFPMVDSSTGETTGVVEYLRDVTESRRTESTALALGRILEESLNEIYIFDAETLRFTQVNRGARENLGYSLERIRELTPLDLKPEYTSGAFGELLGQLRRGEKERLEFSTVHRRRDGSLYPVEVYLQMSTYAGRAVFAETVRDITMRKRTEAKIMRMNRLLRAITKTQAMYLSEKDTGEVYGSLLDDLLELTNSEYGFIGEVIHEPGGGRYLVAKAIADMAWDETKKKFYDEASPKDMEFRKLDNLFGGVVLDGKPVISNKPSSEPGSAGLPGGHPPLRSFLGVPIMTGGRMVGMAGIANKPSGYSMKDVEYLEPFLNACGDIIESERGLMLRADMEESLRKSEAGMRSIIEALPDMVISLGRDGSVLRVKYFDEKEFKDETENGNEQGMRLHEMLPLEVSDIAKTHIEEVFEDGRMRTFEYQVALPQKGMMHYETRLVKGSGDEVIALVRDVTERRELDRQKADMLAMVRHDVKTPLSVILGYVDFLNKDKAGSMDDETVKMIGAIGNNARYISGMLDDIVDIFKLESGRLILKKTEVDPAELVLEVKINATDPARNKGIELIRAAPDGLPSLEVDRSYVMRALTNLVLNAVNFTQEGGKVEIGAALVEEGGQRFVSLRVTDNGPGIADEEKEKVFEKYYRSARTRSVKGSGLGLAIVRAITEAHGGRVKLESELGKGSTFSMFLPV